MAERKNMKEVYRSFEGKLGVENQCGYIVYEGENMYQIEFVNVFATHSHKFRVQKKYFDINKAKDMMYFGELEADVEYGRIDGQVLYKNQWFSPQKMMEKYRDYNWKRHIVEDYNPKYSLRSLFD